MLQDDDEYFSRRALQERQAALSAEKQSVRMRHLEFALAYEFRVRELRAQQRRPVFRFIETDPESVLNQASFSSDVPAAAFVPASP
jgi:hypothetical protein